MMARFSFFLLALCAIHPAATQDLEEGQTPAQQIGTPPGAVSDNPARDARLRLRQTTQQCLDPGYLACSGTLNIYPRPVLFQFSITSFANGWRCSSLKLTVYSWRWLLSSRFLLLPRGLLHERYTLLPRRWMRPSRGRMLWWRMVLPCRREVRARRAIPVLLEDRKLPVSDHSHVNRHDVVKGRQNHHQNYHTSTR